MLEQFPGCMRRIFDASVDMLKREAVEGRREIDMGRSACYEFAEMPSEFALAVHISSKNLEIQLLCFFESIQKFRTVNVLSTESFHMRRYYLTV